jgi:1A family penicillin-binding protein
MSWQRTWRVRLKKLKKKTPFKKLTKAQVLKYLAVASFSLVLFLFFLSTVLFAWYAKDLPQPDKIVRKEGFSTKIYDRNEVLLYDVFADQQRTPVKLSEVPESLRNATIAIEDKNFYKHQGFDVKGWLRAGFNIVFRHRLEGGSTLTQQLVKNVLLTPSRTISRKIKEFALAIQIEKKYSKDEILQMYLNEAPYGGTAWGVEAAAETYFEKKVSELNLVESAILAGLPQSPSYYSPFGENPKVYITRTTAVLRRMREDGYISSEEEKKALQELDKVEFTAPSQKFKAPHFVMYVKKILEEKYGERMVEQGGLRIYTTLDWEVQEKAQKIVAEEIKKVEDIHITNGASLVMDTETGEILAMVGSKDYFDPDYDGQVNVVLSLRQPGSSIKPVTYATAFKKGYTPSTVIADVITHFPGGTGPDYVPKNYDGKVNGPVFLRNALGSSLNIPSVKLLALVGVQDMLETAYSMGLETLEPTRENVNRFGLSVTLGGGEVRLLDMVSAYSAFANGGLKVSPVSVLKVEDQNGKVLEEHKAIKGKRVLEEEEAYLVNNILSDNNARLITFGQNSLLNISTRSVAVKTGTTDDMKDNWTIGWDPKYIVGIWVGNNDNSFMKQVASGVSGASPIWRQTILEVLKDKPIREFSMPSRITTMEVDKISGFKSHDGWPSFNEYFIKGTEPDQTDPIHTKLKVCKGDQSKLAPDTMIAKGDYEEKEFILLKEEDPLSSDGKNRWQEAIDAWIASQDDERYKYPKEYCSSSDEVVVGFKTPHNKDEVSNDFEVEVEAVSNNSIKEVKIYVNGDEKAKITQKPFKTRLVLDNGTYTLKARAQDDKGKSAQTEIKIGVNKAWDWKEQASPSPSPSQLPSPSPSILPSPTASPESEETD